MSKTVNTTNTTGNYFDLNEYVGKLTEVYVAARVAQSTAWRIDTLIVNSSRNIFKYVREELFTQGGAESFSELNTALSEAEFAEQSFADIGLREQGDVEIIRALNAQRDQWHDLAKQLTSLTLDYRGAPRVYEIPELESVFFKEMNTEVAKNTQRKLMMSAKKRAQALGAPDMADRMFERRLDRARDKRENMADKMQAMAPGIHHMFRCVLRSDEESAATRSKAFYTLPLEVQRSLLNNAMDAAARASDDAADERMSDREFENIDDCCLLVERDLKNVLSSERFRVAERTEASQV